MFGKIKTYASLVKFSHTIFAMPFALTALFYAHRMDGYPIGLLLFLKILLCMVFARNAAMGFNRYADRKIDAANPRTKNREIPAGKLSAASVLAFVIINAALFVAVAAFINPLTFYLSPVALLVILGYSLTKRFTCFSHIFLGMSLAIAPMGAYIAVTGQFAVLPLILSLLVLTWSSGFDIIYSLQDKEFDCMNNLYSMPAKLGIKGSLIVSIALHILTFIAVIDIGLIYDSGTLYWIGAGIFTLLLAYQHILVTPKNLSKVNMAFATVNGIASIIYATFTIIDFYV